MSSPFKGLLQKPIFLLLAVNLIAGFFIFRHYGLSWDEPLFYEYGNALGYAYSPNEWFSGQFDLEQSYGPSGDDHKTRGPAYLLLARGPVYLLEAAGLDQASAWHLVNFLFFQIGVYFLYRLSRRWMKPEAALAASALFAWQPLLWGHAFINPKDPPFLMFFLASVCLGFEMVDKLVVERKPKLSIILFPAILVGITTSIRVLGPLAGLLVFIYFVSIVFQKKNLSVSVSLWFALFLYGFIAIFTMFLTWPYLWESPLARFLEVFRFMSDNPTNLSVLFGGEVYRAGELPRRYLPFMLATTLTEPVWILFILGVIIGYRKLVTDRSTLRTSKLVTASLTLGWFFLLVCYVLLRRPAMYDGIRHFLFILPPVFIFSGFALEFLANRVAPFWLYAGMAVLILLPGVVASARLHPYEYTYYNSFAGGTEKVFRNYETEYWLTCYKEAVENLNPTISQPTDLYVHREPQIAEYYAKGNLIVQKLRGAVNEVESGDYILVNTRTNEDRQVFSDAPPILQIKRGSAVFCSIKKVP